MKIISSDNNSPLHFGRDDNTLQDFSPNGDIAGERAFLIDIFRFNGFFGSSEAQSDVFEVSDTR